MTTLAPIFAPWPAPKTVKALVTTRFGGASLGAFTGLNLSFNVGDDAACVQENHVRLQHHCQLPAIPLWLKQVHGTDIIDVSHQKKTPHQVEADGACTSIPECVLAVMTADCLPVFITDKHGKQITVLHAGWRGLAQGIIAQGIARFECPASELLVWLGPAIGPDAFEVGDDVRDVFLQQHSYYSDAFAAFGSRWRANIYALARITLHDLGVQAIYGGERCTFSEPEHFYSYRRDTQTGRMASLMWLEKS